MLVSEDGTWMRLPAGAAAEIERLAARFEPFPGSTIGLPDAPGRSPRRPARPTAAGRAGSLIAALAAVVLLVLSRMPRARDFLAARP